MTADIDGDGDLDALSASALDDEITWHENVQGDGSTWTAHFITTSADRAHGVFAADLDGDGDMDVLSASIRDDRIAWYENSLGDGSVWTSRLISGTADGAMWVIAADIDGDEDLDVLSASGLDDKVSWYENSSGDGATWTEHTIALTADGAHAVSVADLDGDGDLDALSASRYDDKIAWYENISGDGSLWASHEIATSADGARSVLAVDMDGDDDHDVVSASFYDSSITWYENNLGDGSSWTAHPITNNADGAHQVIANDMDRDGDIDVLSASTLDNKIAWYENTVGDGSAWNVQTITTSTERAEGVFSADVDGDGDPDILSASFDDNTIAWYENETASSPAPFTLGGDPVVDPADFRSTTFASGLNNPFSMQELSDGSILVGTSSTGSFSSSGQLLRLVDNDGDGVADDSGSVLFGGLSPRVTSVRLAGELVFVNSVGSSITVLRQGATPADPYTLVGSINFNYPAGREHLAHTLAVRPTPGQPGLFDVFFNLGAAENFAETTTTVPVSGLLNGNLAGDAIHMFTVDDTGASPVFSNLTQIATGVRNPGGLAFHPVTGDLYFSENGIDGLANRNEPLSADELNLIPAANIGGAIEDFGFPDNYIEYRTGTEIGSGGIDPLYAFQPLPNPQGGADLESEGPVEIAFAPTTFPEGLNDGVFVTFHGKGSVGTVNEENPLVYASLDTSHYFHIISNQEPALGPLDSVLATTDSIFLADFRGNGAGALYQIQVDTVVDPGNQQPEVVAPIADLTVPENSPSVLDYADLNAVFEDPDHLDSELAYTLEANTPGGIVTVNLAADDTLDLSFVTNASGMVDITVRATDPGALFAEDTFQITVTAVNSPPQVVNQIPNLTVDLGSPPILDYADLNAVFQDPDNLDSELTYNLVGNVPAGIVNVTLGPDDKLDLNFFTGATGTAVVTVRATDPGLLFAEEAFLVTVTPDNQAPQVVSPIPNLTVPRSSPPVLDYADLNAVFQDPDHFDSQLFYTISANFPSGIVTVNIGPDDHLDLSFAADTSGTVNITVRATDPGLRFAEDTFRVTILGSVTAETVGLHDGDGGRFFFNNTNEAGPADLTVRFGPRGVDWLPLVGDWNGNDFDTPGLYVPEGSTFFLRNTGTPGTADLGFVFGTPGAGWLPVSGDWNGNGFDSPGLYDPEAGRFLLRNFSAAGSADSSFRFGPRDAGWVPIVGDWDGDGRDGVGLFDFAAGKFFLKNEPTPGPADVFFRFGPAGIGWQPFAGDWDGDGDDNVGLYDSVAGKFYLINENVAGVADLVFSFGPKNFGWTPLAGDWNGPTISGAAAGTEGGPSSLEAPAAFTNRASTPSDQGLFTENGGSQTISARDTGPGRSGTTPFPDLFASRIPILNPDDSHLNLSNFVSTEDQAMVSRRTVLETALLEWVDEIEAPLTGQQF